MSALRKPTENLIPAEDIFRERCEARAILCEACVYDLIEAVDGLQADAERTGLVDEIGQDAVQAMMANAFAIVPRVGEAKAESRPTTATMPKPRPGAAASTIMAPEYLVQQNDPARLKQWLAKHSAAERIAITKHLRGKR